MSEEVPRIRIGYKQVKLADGRYGVATLRLEQDSRVIQTGYQVKCREMPFDPDAPRLQRTNRVRTLKIVPNGRPDEVVSKATSCRAQNPLVYQVGQYTECELNTTDPKGAGIHFFWEEKVCGLWTMLFK